MTPTCDTCRHWTSVKDDWDGPLKVRWYDDIEDEIAANAQRNADYGRCDAAKFFDDVGDKDDPPLAVTVDGSGYTARLYTRAAFGCVMHEPCSKQCSSIA